jgi:hypothetical protein
MGNGCSIDTQYSNVIYVKPQYPISNIMDQMNDLEEDEIIIDMDSKINNNIITTTDAKKQLETFISFYTGTNREFNKIKEYINTFTI